MSALFGGGRPREQSKYLVEFRAGKMTFDADSKLVTPDKRRGTVMVHQAEDQLMHFMWRDRGAPSGSAAEDDLIIFPDDVEFKRVSQCTTGRVYLLQFKSSSRKMFFWMQEPKTDKVRISITWLNYGHCDLCFHPTGRGELQEGQRVPEPPSCPW